MFAINHAATALVIKRKYQDVSLVPILISVQLMELVWVALNYAGIERLTTEPVVRYVGDIHLAYMPFSHSIATTLGAAALAGAIITYALNRPRLAAAVALGIVSHLVLDLFTHDADIALAPFTGDVEFGSGLYSRFPAAAFAVEFGYGILCWWIYGGSAWLLAVIAVFNLANLSMFFSGIPGLEGLMAGRATLLTTVILAQIVVTLALVWIAANGRRRRSRSRQNVAAEER
jgi:membrane-bound metal-dependent hydrolase YbcI (DUF457 family)